MKIKIQAYISIYFSREHFWGALAWCHPDLPYVMKRFDFSGAGEYYHILCAKKIGMRGSLIVRVDKDLPNIIKRFDFSSAGEHYHILSECLTHQHSEFLKKVSSASHILLKNNLWKK